MMFALGFITGLVVAFFIAIFIGYIITKNEEAQEINDIKEAIKNVELKGEE